MITYMLQTITIGDQQLILDILTLYICLCMVRIYIAIQEGAAAVVTVRGFPTIVAMNTTSLMASTTPCSMARHQLCH